MKRRLVMLGWIAALLAGALALSACTGKDAVNQTAGGQFRFVSGTSLGKTYPVDKRKAAGDFTGTLLGGGKLTLSQYAGKVVVINFWATWCGPCTTETPQFDAVYRANKAKGVQFIGIDTKDIQSKAQAFVTDNQITYPIVSDETTETALALGRIPALSLPFTVLVDKKGRIAAVYLMTLSAKDLQPVIDQLLAET